MTPYQCLKCGGKDGRTCDCLTFAEAMALDPSEVEIHWNSPDDWRRLDGEDARKAPHWVIRQAKFRRSRPKRSRVQEMALTHTGKERQSDARSDYEEAIRAVCEWLRSKKPAVESIIAGDVERHFLEPR